MSDEPNEPSSPACLAHEANDAYMGFATRDELAAFLKELLEAERAGADPACIVRKLKEMLPKVRDEGLHRDLSERLRSYEINIERAAKARRTSSGV